MGGSGGMFGSSKQKTSGQFKADPNTMAGEQEAIQRQRDIASGNSPSIAQMQFLRNLDAQNNSSLALAASQRGSSNPSLAFRQAQLMSQQAGIEGAQQGAIMAEQERRAADGFLQQTAAGQRGVALQSATANQQADSQKAASDKQMFGNLGAAFAVSDENSKTNKKPSKQSALRAVEEFLNSVEPYEYNYKGGDKIDRKGVMAQDLEDSELGKQMVKDTPGGKVVDYGQGFSAMMAGIAELNKKVSKIEKKR